jgi:dihydroxy-acid dehydratase
VVKTAGFDLEIFEGPARVFERERAAMDALTEGKIVAGDVVVIRYEGPRVALACARCWPSPPQLRVRA